MPMSLSRTTTSIIAVGAGVVLLSAAGGSFAQWSDSKEVSPGVITAGHLNMSVDTGSWFNTKGTEDRGDDSAIDPSSFRMVPGDTVEYRATVRPDLVGDTLKADLATELRTVTGTLASFVTTGSSLDGATGPVEITPQDTRSGKTYNAVVKVAMPFGAGATTAPAGGEDATLDLSTLKITLVQKR